MRKVVLLMVAMVAAVVVGVVVYNSKPSIKLLEELPTESLLPYRDCSIEVSNGEALVVPQAGKSD